MKDQQMATIQRSVKIAGLTSNCNKEGIAMAKNRVSALLGWAGPPSSSKCLQ
jgi:hypothetical protein